MFRLKIVTFLVFTLLVADSIPANAIFGLSKCEKVSATINAEQAIGLENFKSYDRNRDALLKKSKISLGEWWTAIKTIKVVYISDIEIFKLIEENRTCFTSKFAADNRENLESYQNSLDLIVKYEPVYAKIDSAALKKNIDNDSRNVLRSIYKNYFDWKTGVKLG